MAFDRCRIVIIGAAGGIGSALSRRLSVQKADLVLLGRDAQKLSTLGSELGAESFAVDATQPDQLEQALSGLGPFHGIANCAGSLLLKPAHLTSEADWKHTIDTNLTTAYATVRAAAKSFPASGGSIVLCASAASRVGLANHEAIAAAKGGVMALTLSAAATYAAKNIRVNCVAPGLVDTPLTSKITSSESGRKASIGMHPLMRIGKPEDVASGIAWFLDPENSWVTGQILGIDGGLSTVRSR